LQPPVKYTVKDANGCETTSQDVVTSRINATYGFTFYISKPTCVSLLLKQTVEVFATSGYGTLNSTHYTAFDGVPTTTFTQTAQVKVFQLVLQDCHLAIIFQRMRMVVRTKKLTVSSV
jgi:hypothetical protein